MTKNNAAADELRTLRDCLRYAVSRFGEAGIAYGQSTDNAYDEAAYLILHTLHLPLERLEPFLDARLTADERRRVLAVVERRAAERIPAAYLTHEAWLGDLRFYVDERVIIPRSHIASLLRERLEPWIADPGRVGRALDLCTGSGCLAVLLAHAFPQACVDAVDISEDALQVARRNVADHGLQERIELLRSDLFSALANRRYDVIVSNPPYVTSRSMADLPAEFRREPALALAAGEDGMDVVRGIIAGAREHLTRGGLLIVEVGANRKQAEQAFADIELTWLDTGSGADEVFLVQREQLPAPGRRR